MNRLIVLTLLTVSLNCFAKEAVVDDFEGYKAGKFPSGWGIKKGLWYTSGEDNTTCKVLKENEKQFLRVDSKADSITLGKEYQYNLEKFKFLKWQWRVHKLPIKGDEGKKESGDSAAGIYVVFPGFIIPYTIKYVWSSTLKIGTVLDSPFSGRTKIIVVRSGKEELGKWLSEKVNVFEDYKKVFKKDSLDKTPKVIALLTDSDNTVSTAMADYDDISVATE